MTRRAGTVPEETRSRLLESAAEEFAEYGFEKASLRRICSGAEVTTGALYFFFQDKEDLFQSVIAPVTEPIMALMESHYEMELASPAEHIAKEETEDVRAADEFLDLYYSNRKLCRIVLANRTQPAVVDFFARITSLIDRQTGRLLQQFLSTMKAGTPGAAQPEFPLPDRSMFNECTVHWISHLQLDGILHILSHDFSKERAKEQTRIMIRFLRGGFFALLPGIEFMSGNTGNLNEPEGHAAQS